MGSPAQGSLWGWHGVGWQMVQAAGPLYGNCAGEGRHKDRAQVGAYLLPQPHPAQPPGSGTQRPTHPPATLCPLPSPLPSKSLLKAPPSCPASFLCLLLCQLPSLSKHLTFSFPFSTSPHPRRSKAPFCPQASPRNKDECEWTGTGHHLDHPSHPIKFHPALNLCTTLLSGLRVELRCWFGQILHLFPHYPHPSPQRRWANGRCSPRCLADGATTAPAWAAAEAPGFPERPQGG